MGSILKGNFKTKKKVEAKPDEETSDLDQRFEREAMKRLGGSMAFVRKKQIMWGDEDDSK